MKMIIVGVTKCGTSSLEKWLKDRGHDVINFQTLATLPHGVLIYKNHYSDYTPVLVFRNYKDRQKSFYAFYTDYGGSVKDSKGQTDQYNIENIMAQWKSHIPIVYRLDDLVKYQRDFPKLNRA